MLVAIGFVIVTYSVLGGFAFMGGHLLTLWQPVEVLIIGGGALGAMENRSGRSNRKRSGVRRRRRRRRRPHSSVIWKWPRPFCGVPADG